jgi:hypothetical protein
MPKLPIISGAEAVKAFERAGDWTASEAAMLSS